MLTPSAGFLSFDSSFQSMLEEHGAYFLFGQPMFFWRVVISCSDSTCNLINLPVSEPLGLPAVKLMVYTQI